jgi:rhomboid protease GluP
MAKTARVTTVAPMSSSEVCLDPPRDPAAEGLVEIGVYSTFAGGSERGLVVLTMGLSYWLVPSGDAFALLVEAPVGGAVREQLARFERESVGWPPAPLPTGERLQVGAVLGSMLWVLAIFAAFWGAQRRPELFEAGALDARALWVGGEWWRPFTALFLHADSGHLVSNAVSGAFVFSLVAATLGGRRGWCLLILAAVLGNLASAAAHFPAAYHSVGASTAIFAGLGLLTGHAIRTAARSSMFVPLGAGLTVLALFGAGGLRVDVGAHLCGFAAGLGLGILPQRQTATAATIPPDRPE